MNHDGSEDGTADAALLGDGVSGIDNYFMEYDEDGSLALARALATTGGEAGDASGRGVASDGTSMPRRSPARSAF